MDSKEILAIGLPPNTFSHSDADDDCQKNDPSTQYHLADVSISSDFCPNADESSTPKTIWPTEEFEQDFEVHPTFNLNSSSPLARSRHGSMTSSADRTSIAMAVNCRSRHPPSFIPDWTFPHASLSDQNYEITSGAIDSSGHKLGTSSMTPRFSSVQHNSIAQSSRHQRLNSALWFGQSRESCDNGVLATEEGLFVQSKQWHPHRDRTMQTESVLDVPACLDDRQSLSAALPARGNDENEFPTASWTRGDDGSYPYRFTASAPASICCEDVVADDIASQEERSMDDRTLRDILDEIREQRLDRVIHFTQSGLTTNIRTSSCRSAMARPSADDSAFANQEFDHYRRSLDRRVLELLKQDHAQGDAVGEACARDRESTGSEGDLKSRFTIPGKYNHPSYLRLNGINHQPPATRDVS
jgi:hypothetical protein